MIALYMKLYGVWLETILPGPRSMKNITLGPATPSSAHRGARSTGPLALVLVSKCTSVTE